MTRLVDLKVGDKVKRINSNDSRFLAGSIHIVDRLVIDVYTRQAFTIKGFPSWTFVLNEDYWQLIEEETTTMSTKIEQAEKRIEEAMEQLEAAKLALKEAEEVKKNPLFGEIGNDQQLNHLLCAKGGELIGTNSTYITYAGSIGFTDRKSAGLVAEAISTLLLLRAQEGVTSMDGHSHYVYNNKIDVSWGSPLKVVPHFTNEGLANKATEMIGEVRIIRMFKIFNGEAV